MFKDQGHRSEFTDTDGEERNFRTNNILGFACRTDITGHGQRKSKLGTSDVNT